MHCYYWDFAIWPFTSLIMISYWDLYRSRRNSVIDTWPSTTFITPRLFVRGSPGITGGLGLLGCNTSLRAGDSGSRGCTDRAQTPPGKVTPGPSRRPSPSVCEGPAGREGGREAGRQARMQGNGDAGRQRPAASSAGLWQPRRASTVALRRQVRQKTCVSLRAYHGEYFV